MIKTDFVSYRNSLDKTIVAAFDHVTPFNKKLPLIIIPNAFGETKCDSISLAYFLAVNGFNVLRYDGTNHPGESDGDIFHFTLSGGKSDLIVSIDFVEKFYNPRKIGVVAKSLSWRYSLRAAAGDPRIKFLLGIGGIVNLQGTLKAIYREDIVQLISQGKYNDWKFSDIFGFQISINFMEDAIANMYHTIKTTIDDICKLKIPITYLLAENDAWVSASDVDQVMVDSNSETNVHIVKDVLHQINENPSGAMYVFRQTVVSCKRYLSGIKIRQEDVIKPALKIEAAQNRVEKERLRTNKITKEQEKSFWRQYLKKYSFISKVPDFRAYLDDVVELFGETGRNDIVLDLGCGPGHLCMWLLERNADHFPFYKGIDIVESVLSHAYNAHLKLVQKIGKPQLEKKISYLVGDLDWGNRDNSVLNSLDSDSIDRICCSLLVSYIKHPQFVLKECHRMLKPGGRVIVSSLKPYADLSLIYRNFVDKIKNKRDIEKAIKLLSSSGMIRLKESQGYYRFYSEKQLLSLMKKAGFGNIKCYRSFGDQANIVLAIKD